MEAIQQPSEQYFLCQGIYTCVIDDGLVILDVRSNQYIGIESRHIPVLATHVQGLDAVLRASGRTLPSTDSHDLAIVEELAERRILTRSADCGSKAQLCSASPSESISLIAMGRPKPRIQLHHLARFVTSWAFVLGALKISGPERIVRRLQAYAKHPASCDLAADSGRACDLLSVFLRVRPWFYTAHDVCLFDSFVLADFLNRYKVCATFVIGIGTKPFLAHAWVQYGDHVLDDAAEHVRTYVPILAV